MQNTAEEKTWGTAHTPPQLRHVAHHHSHLFFNLYQLHLTKEIQLFQSDHPHAVSRRPNNFHKLKILVAFLLTRNPRGIQPH